MFLEVTDSKAGSSEWSCFVSHRLSVVNQKFEGDRLVSVLQEQIVWSCRHDVPKLFCSSRLLSTLLLQPDMYELCLVTYCTVHMLIISCLRCHSGLSLRSLRTATASLLKTGAGGNFCSSTLCLIRRLASWLQTPLSLLLRFLYSRSSVRPNRCMT